MAEKSLNVYEIITAISQAANIMDGQLDSDGNPIKIGLRREEEVGIHDKRVIDGFKVKLGGDVLHLSYQSEVRLRDVHDKKFENDITGTLQEIVKFLKSEFKSITGKALALEPIDDEPHIVVQSASRVRTWVEATQKFRIGNLKDNVSETGSSEERLQKNIKKWLSDQPPGIGGKRPENDTRKVEKEDKK